MGEGKAPFIIDNRDSDISEKVQGYLHDYCELSNQFDIATGYCIAGTQEISSEKLAILGNFSTV